MWIQTISKDVDGSFPQPPEESFRQFRGYRKSRRLAKEFYKTSLETLRENLHLRVILPYSRVYLKFNHKDEEGSSSLLYTRFFMTRGISAWTITQKEDKGLELITVGLGKYREGESFIFDQMPVSASRFMLDRDYKMINKQKHLFKVPF